MRYHPAVVADVNATASWYDERGIALGNRFRAAVVGTIENIAAAPEIFGYLFDDLNIRVARAKRFPYLILFRYEREYTKILAILHAASDPQTWRTRVETE